MLVSLEGWELSEQPGKIDNYRYYVRIGSGMMFGQSTNVEVLCTAGFRRSGMI